MNKQCQNCKNEFEITDEDTAFYRKIDVPPPTFCPQCRFQRRAAFRNERKLFRRKSAMSGKDILSLYPESSGIPVYSEKEWWSDDWDASEYGRDYDFSRPLLEQILELSKEVPRATRSVINMVESDYSANAGNLKNCYLLFNSNYSEDCAYGNAVDHCNMSFDNSHADHSDRIYNSFWMTKSYQARFCVQCEECTDIWFSKNCKGCTNCFGCVNLRNQKYHIWNEPYSKEGYEKKIAEMKLDTPEGISRAMEKAKELWLKHPVKFMQGTKNVDVSGEYVENSKNVKYGYLVRDGEDMKYVQYFQVGPNKDCYDFSIWGENNNLGYENSVCGYGTSNLRFCWETYSEVRDLEYCMSCITSSNLFGCVGLRNKEYYILNKQYSKEDFLELRAKIIKHMNEMPFTDKAGNTYKYGEFFPPEFSPFGYNHTVAQEHFPLSETEAKDKGFNWNDIPKTEYEITMNAKDLPQSIKDAEEGILKEIIGCLDCGRAYRIIRPELDFLKQEGIALPRRCVDCRHKSRIAFRNKSKLYKRKCQCAGETSENNKYTNTSKNHPDHAPDDHCPNEFQTSYSPDRPEIVYCQDCYQAEVL